MFIIYFLYVPCSPLRRACRPSCPAPPAARGCRAHPRPPRSLVAPPALGRTPQPALPARKGPSLSGARGTAPSPAQRTTTRSQRVCPHQCSPVQSSAVHLCLVLRVTGRPITVVRSDPVWVVPLQSVPV
eukprot:1177559-Prorocentrum_minimum.AAC.5